MVHLQNGKQKYFPHSINPKKKHFISLIDIKWQIVKCPETSKVCLLEIVNWKKEKNHKAMIG